MRTTVLILLLTVGVQWLYAQPARKRSPALQQLRIKDETRIFWIVSRQPDSLRKHFEVIDERPGGLLVVKSTWKKIDSLEALMDFIDMPRIPKEETPLPVYDQSLNTVNQVHHFYPALTGNNLVLSLKENKPDSTDLDLRGRWLPTSLASPLFSAHATSMATIAAGGGNSYYTGKGAAPGAILSSADFASLLPETDAQYRQYQVAVQNHSYGTGIENYYGADALAYDASVVANPVLVHVFSAGNSGEATSTSGPYSGMVGVANLTGSFKMAKNILTVSATDSFGLVSPLSSRGPAYDGRVKPELVAFGQDGSSGAAALTSGAVLLLQQAYAETHGGTLPPAALVKAALITSAKDIGTAGPDFISGYGTLNTFKALQIVQGGQYFEGSGNADFTLHVQAGIRKLKLTLCWIDPPAPANASRALVRDLDLELQKDGLAWKPWVLNSKPVKDSLVLPAVRGRDTLNTIEQITLDNPAAGTYTVNIKSPGTAFYVAWQLDTANRFVWTYPTGSDQLVGGTRNIIRWSNTFDAASGVLEYSVDKGISWKELITTADEFFAWPVPDTFCTALLRMTTNERVYLSDTFTISSPLYVQVGFHCADSTMLAWNASAPAYRLYALGGRYLEAIRTLTDTSLVLQHPATNWYAIAPLLGNQEGIRSYTLDVTQQGVGCYVRNFLADLVNSQTARLSIELGTSLHVKRLVVEKLVQKEYHVLQTIEPVNGLYYEVMDDALHHGGNSYRLRIELTNGAMVFSELQTVYSFRGSPYLVFPNPARVGGTVQVVAEDVGNNARIVVFNVFGQKVLEQPLRSLFERIELTGVQAGVYIIAVVKDGSRAFSTKLVVAP